MQCTVCSTKKEQGETYVRKIVVLPIKEHVLIDERVKSVASPFSFASCNTEDTFPLLSLDTRFSWNEKSFGHSILHTTFKNQEVEQVTRKSQKEEEEEEKMQKEMCILWDTSEKRWVEHLVKRVLAAKKRYRYTHVVTFLRWGVKILGRNFFSRTSHLHDLLLRKRGANLSSPSDSFFTLSLSPLSNSWITFPPHLPVSWKAVKNSLIVLHNCSNFESKNMNEGREMRE